MPRGGSKPGERRGGRKKGSPNNRTQATIALAEAGGTMPLPALLSVMRYWLSQVDAELAKGDEANTPVLHQALDHVRISAKDAAPYLHATIKAQVQIPHDDASQLAEMQGVESRLTGWQDSFPHVQDHHGAWLTGDQRDGRVAGESLWSHLSE